MEFRRAPFTIKASRVVHTVHTFPSDDVTVSFNSRICIIITFTLATPAAEFLPKKNGEYEQEKPWKKYFLQLLLPSVKCLKASFHR